MATAAFAAAGYRARKEGQHYLVLQSLAFMLKTDPKVIKQLDKFRQKRNISDYDQPGLVTEQEVEEMITLAQQIRDNVEEWIRTNHVGLAKEL